MHEPGSSSKRSISLKFTSSNSGTKALCNGVLPYSSTPGRGFRFGCFPAISSPLSNANMRHRTGALCNPKGEQTYGSSGETARPIAGGLHRMHRMFRNLFAAFESNDLLPCLSAWSRVAAIPNVASHPPAIAGLPLVDRNVFSRILHGWASRFGIEADRVCAPLERPLSQNPHLIH